MRINALLNNAPSVSNRTAPQKYPLDNVMFPPAAIFGHFTEEIGLNSRNFMIPASQPRAV
jgi:hypothetical protein